MIFSISLNQAWRPGLLESKNQRPKGTCMNESIEIHIKTINKFIICICLSFQLTCLYRFYIRRLTKHNHGSYHKE
jgi:hypothetical protein